MSKAKLNKLSKIEKEYQELLRKREEAKEEAFKSVGQIVFKNWNIEELEDYDLLEEFIKDKADEFNYIISESDESDADDEESKPENGVYDEYERSQED